MEIDKVHFENLSSLIKETKVKIARSVNAELVNLYWQIGEYLSKQIRDQGWGKSVVVQFANYLQMTEFSGPGFSDKNLWRMKQFYETYHDHPKLSALLREITWTNHLLIFSKTRTIEEKEFYIRLCVKEKYSSRELERQLNSAVFERTMLGNAKLSSTMRVLSKDIGSIFRDSYVLEFLDLPETHVEKDLKSLIAANIRTFLLEFGKDFAFLGEEYRLQVGNHDFFIDLLFYNRSLSCLIAIELKVVEFSPEHLGQLNFYLEALDRDVRKPSENPSIGILLCKNKDETVVEYALSRTLSPTLVADYQTKLPDKKILQAHLQQLFNSGSSELE
ncbi:YhcG family protein [Dyadobacter sp. CY356]|uniref:PDDEXK nuclease domain-containing protein n=1 Tax=Dyadobacter sp. CY356 TaxID=2906442 RepID=UPI001F2A5414|nr:PDDEXK nuclease domain-containing protein [Dyadobacter sp. CY356]MCF0057811.1 PDDEXK nuclease domain-containing protein [Dyadobacter sp. CY356]